MPFDASWQQLFPGIISPRLDGSAAANAADDFFGFSDPTMGMPELWPGPASSSSDTMDTRAALNSPAPASSDEKAKNIRQRKSARRGRPPHQLPPSALSDGRPPTKQQAPPQQKLPEQVSSPFNNAAAPNQGGQRYQFKPIIARDINSIPAMFQNFPAIVAKNGPAADRNGPMLPTDTNILQTIAPQAQLNSNKRKRSASVPACAPPPAISRARAASEQLLLKPPEGLKNEQQVADFKRRKQMQYAFTQMETLVPSKFYSRPSRANLLLGAVEYILHLKTVVGQLEKQVKPSDADGQAPPKPDTP